MRMGGVMGSMPSSCVVDRVYRVSSDEDGWCYG